MRKRKITYEDSLTLTRHVLTQEYFLTPCSLSRLLQCSKPTVYARIAALEKQGVQIEQKFLHTVHPGPKSMGFRIVPTGV